MENKIDVRELSEEFQDEIDSCLDAEMQREMYTTGLEMFYEEDFKFADELKALGIKPECGEFCIIVTH